MNVYLITAVSSYLLGSIPFGYLLVRVFRGEDVRASGSGNIGATNVARRSRVLGIATLLLDAGKGIAAVVLAGHVFSDQHQGLLATTAAMCAVLGHMFPVWLKFLGGKGVATAFGSFALIAPKSVLCMVGIFIVVAAIFRYVSLASVVTAACLPILGWVFRESSETKQSVLVLAASILIIWKHRENIRRIAGGVEPKLGPSAK